MIISRRYVPFWILAHRDYQVARIFDTMFDNSHLAKKRCRELWEMWERNNICLADVTMGTGIPNFEYLKTELAKLDAQHEYDNDLSLFDVNNVEIVYKEDNLLTLKLSNVSDFEQIVQVITLEQESNKDKPKIYIDNNVRFGYD